MRAIRLFFPELATHRPPLSTSALPAEVASYGIQRSLVSDAPAPDISEEVVPEATGRDFGEGQDQAHQDRKTYEERVVDLTPDLVATLRRHPCLGKERQPEARPGRAGMALPER